MIKIKHIIISIIVALLIIFHEYVYIGLWFCAAYVEKFYMDIKCCVIEYNYREENKKVAEKWIEDTYGKTVSDVIEIKYIGKDRGWGTSSAFYISAPFTDGTIYVTSNQEHDVIGGLNINGSKFQHLYSEWVKKQVGIEDDNIELKFAGNFDKPYIEFDKITTLSEDYREVFENTHNLYAWLCEVKNIKDLDKNNILNYAQKIREDYLLKAISKTGMPSSSKYGGRIYLSKTNNAREKGNSYKFDFDINDKNDIYSELKCKKIE